MSILINLLPDLRQAKLREQRRRQMAIGVTLLVSAVSAGSVLVLFLFSAGQQVNIKVHNDNIAKSKTQLEQIDGLPDALTALQHLESLPDLYAQRVLFTKFFAVYSEFDPIETTLDSLTVNEQNALQVNGSSRSYASVAKLARALEQANVTLGTGAKATNTPYFESVAITNASTISGKGISFTIRATVSSEVLHGSK